LVIFLNIGILKSKEGVTAATA